MAITRNGWDVYTSSSNKNLVNFSWITGRVRGGDHFVVLNYIAERFHNEVEKIRKDWSWGYAYRDVRGVGGVISEHATGTAVDFNAPNHPIGKKNTFSVAKRAVIRQIMKDVRGAARWGGEWSRPDDMHFELIGGNVKVKEVADLIRAGKLPKSGDVKPTGSTKPSPSKPKPAPAKKLDTGVWPGKPLPVTDKHTTQSHNAWVELMAAVGYKDAKLGLALQKWLAGVKDPRTGHGYYDTRRFKLDGDFRSESVKGLQRFMYDRKDDNGKRLYNGKADGGRGALTVHAEIGYLNTKANRGVN